VVSKTGAVMESPALIASGGGPGLRQKMLRAGGWILSSNLASQGLRLFSSLVLTRLLVPQAFGLMAAVQTLYFALVMFSDLGIWQSVVHRKKDLDARFLDTAMSLQLLRGGLLALAVLLLSIGLQVAAEHGAFTQGTVYTDPRLPWMMSVFALSALMQGAESLHLATAQRDLRTGELVRLELVSQFAGMVVTVGLALATRSVWSLVVGTLVATGARTLLSHIVLRGAQVRPCWDAACRREITGFGKWIFLSSLIGFAAAHGEKLILGATLSGTGFGIYFIAAALLSALTGVVGTLNAHLIFPGLSAAIRQGDHEAARVYVRLQQAADVFLGLLAGLLFMAGRWLVVVLYDPRYVGAGWMLQVLGLGLLAMRYQVLEQLMFAKGQPHWVGASNALRFASLLALIPLGYTTAGEHGAVIAVAASQFVGWPLALLFKHRLGLLSWRSEAAWPLALTVGLAAGWLLDIVLNTIQGH